MDHESFRQRDAVREFVGKDQGANFSQVNYRKFRLSRAIHNRFAATDGRQQNCLNAPTGKHYFRYARRKFCTAVGNMGAHIFVSNETIHAFRSEDRGD